VKIEAAAGAAGDRRVRSAADAVDAAGSDAAQISAETI
jgi:hypothetical protein